MADVSWPTGADVREWMVSNAFGVDGEDAAVLDAVTSTAKAVLSSRLDSARMPTNTALCPESVALAVKIRAASLYTRRMSAAGVISVSDDTVIRVGRFDSDVDACIAPYLAALVG